MNHYDFSVIYSTPSKEDNASCKELVRLETFADTAELYRSSLSICRNHSAGTVPPR